LAGVVGRMDGTNDVLDVIRHRLSLSHAPKRDPVPAAPVGGVTARDAAESPEGWPASPGRGG
jgi:hypothetical protein